MSASIRSLYPLLAVSIALFAGCTSAPDTDRSRPPPQPVLTGSAQFLGGSLVVDARIGPFHRGELFEGGEGGRAAPDDKSGTPRRRPPAGYDGFGEVGGGHGDSGAWRRQSESGEGRGETGERPTRAGPSGLRGGGSPLRITLTVTLRNTGAVPVHLRVSDLSSPIGNFVPEPETMTLEPGASQSLEAMHSSYPDSFESVGLHVGIRTAAGDEEHVIQLDSAGQLPASR